MGVGLKTRRKQEPSPEQIRVRKSKGKAYGFLLLWLAGLGFIAYGLFQISHEKSFVEAVHRQSSYRLDAAHSRGMIYDCNLVPLVGQGNRTVAAIAPDIQVMGAIRGMMGEGNYNQFADQMESGKPFLLELAEDTAELTQLSRMEEISLFQIPVRYSSNQLAPHVIGYTDAAGKGVAGVEFAMDRVLGEEPGGISLYYEVDAMGRVLGGSRPRVVNTLSRTDRGVVLTLDSRIQQIAEKAGEKLGKGAVVVTEVPNCEIRALVSLPDYAPETLGTAANSPDAPLLNRAFSAYAPGSVFKLVSAAEYLEEGEKHLQEKDPAAQTPAKTPQPDSPPVQRTGTLQEGQGVPVGPLLHPALTAPGVQDPQKKPEGQGGQSTRNALNGPNSSVPAVPNPENSRNGQAQKSNQTQRPLPSQSPAPAADSYTCTGSITVDGQRIHCIDGTAHGPLTLETAIEKSCNCYFIQLAEKMGGQALLKMAYNMGFGAAREFGEGLFSDPGHLPSAQALEIPRALANVSFGQGELTVTPLQVNAMVNAIVSGGKYSPPKLIAGLADDNRSQTQLPQGSSSQIFSPSTGKALEKAMEQAVKTGTAKKGASARYRSGAKTGTAQTDIFLEGRELNHYWYTGYIYDAAGPRYCITVFRESVPEDQGLTAQVFKEIGEALVS